ncbi:unnamed protein product [[Candida] boidinii]|uniref:Small ribosomal subunit protein mS33 n=1 Tax=Candida boidinii TaxID=5477 RepID=A0A9W6T0E1_CANBO|nr:hypothetical protein BVG19_g751 [[Candida] boidinii]OWB49241.1 hypothetical protein B5S27_g781 [[Candida] boidinii]OWB67503.1 hypothetical protein B5S30_g2864 [[Candida] boidinii]OWB83397.1 hypothetical protein B5S33_g2026 [[Candida] boidinii]GME71799.1 unnamed protein product [[Candida] boidinii]
MSQVVKAFKSVPISKLHKLEQLQCQIFRTTFNPTKQKTGAKILSAPLKGQTLANYYGPSDFPTHAKLSKAWATSEYEILNEEEEYRVERVEDLKRRGKGAPKKQREAPSAKGKGKKK